MTRYLIDTHVILWFLDDHSRLSRDARNLLRSGAPVFFSPVSLWEIGIKLSLGKSDFKMQDGWWRMIPEALVTQGIERLDLVGKDFQKVSELPLHHRDPFDRMLLAQASTRGMSIISADGKFAMYDAPIVW